MTSAEPAQDQEKAVIIRGSDFHKRKYLSNVTKQITEHIQEDENNVRINVKDSENEEK